MGMFKNRYARLPEPSCCGGMCVVSKGFDTRLEIPVALKQLKGEYQRNHNSQADQAIERFRLEAKALARVHNEAIVRSFDFHAGTTKDPPTMILEWIPGRTLNNYVQQSGGVDETTIISFARQTLKAVSHCHSKRILHRDINWNNIMITDEGLVKLIDFSIARIDGNVTDYTRFDSGPLTKKYCAPEQITDPMNCDERTDIFLVGYTMITAYGDNQWRDDQLATVFEKATEQSPAMRFSSAEDFLNALQPF